MKSIPTRQFREQPFSWQSKAALRLLRKRYPKRKLPYRKAVYLALTEIESDFQSNPIRTYTNTIATYSGVDRHSVSKILKEFSEFGLIKTEIERDSKGRFSQRKVYLLKCPEADNPPVGNPPEGRMPDKKLNLYKKSIFSNKGIDVETFSPRNREETICWEIARWLGEKDMRFMLSALDKYGLDVIQSVAGIIKTAKSGQIRDKRAYFNALVRDIGAKTLISKN